MAESLFLFLNLFSESFAVDPEAEGGVRNIVDFFQCDVPHGIFYLCFGKRILYIK